MKTFIISYVVPYILCLALAIISWSSSSFAALTPAQVLGTNPAQPDDLREWYCFNAGQVTFTEKCQTTTQGAVSEQGTRCAITFKAVDGTTIYTYGLSHTIDATETKNIKEAWLKDFAHKTPLCLVGIFLEKTTVQNKDQKADKHKGEAHSAPTQELSFTWDHLRNAQSCIGHSVDACPKK